MDAVIEIETISTEDSAPDTGYSKYWKLDELFNGDRLIKEYLSGKPEYMDAVKAMYLEKIDSHFKKNTEAAQEMLSHLKAHGVTVYEVLLRYVSLGDYDMLFIVDEESFEDDEPILKGYRKAGEIRKRFNERFYRLGVSFIMRTDYFDRKLVVCDGFGIIYVEEK